MKPTDFTKIKISEATSIPEDGGFYELVKANYWCVTEDDCILIYKGHSRQCNSNITIAEKLVSFKDHPAVKVVFIENVWVNHNCSHYNY